MKKIGIYLERRPESGGAYQYCLSMLKALSYFPQNEFKIIAFCTFDEWKKVTEQMNIQTEIVSKNFIQKIIHYIAERILSVEFYRKNCKILHPLARKFKEVGIDACIYPCGDKISFMLDTDSIVTVFDLMHRYLNEFPEVANKKIYKSRERSYNNIVKYAKLIFVDSNVGKQQLIECYGTDNKSINTLNQKTKVLSMIAPDYVYGNCKAIIANERVKFDKYIFYPAQFWKHKNHRNLLLSIAELKNKGIIVNLILCGSKKNAFDDVIKIINDNNLQEQVQILGYVSNEELVALYQHARALIMPTFGGPTNIPQLEAFVLGCPVATAKIFGIPEQVGEAALLFNPYSISEIKDCVEKLWNDQELCETLVKRGYEQAEKWGEAQFRSKLLALLSTL